MSAEADEAARLQAEDAALATYLRRTFNVEPAAPDAVAAAFGAPPPASPPPPPAPTEAEVAAEADEAEAAQREASLAAAYVRRHFPAAEAQ